MGAEEGMGRLLVLELELEEVMVCFRAMRIVSVGEGRCVDVKDKEDLVSLADRLRFMVLFFWLVGWCVVLCNEWKGVRYGKEVL